MKKTLLFLALFSCCFFLSVNADPEETEGVFTAYWTGGRGEITVYPTVGGGPLVFICDPNGSPLEMANYDAYWWKFSYAAFHGASFVKMEYYALGGGNLITNDPSFS